MKINTKQNWFCPLAGLCYVGSDRLKKKCLFFFLKYIVKSRNRIESGRTGRTKAETKNKLEESISSASDHA